MLSERHQHDGTPGGGRVVQARHVAGYRPFIVFLPWDFDPVTGTAVETVPTTDIPSLTFTDAADEAATLMFVFPEYKRGIGSIYLDYWNLTNAGDLRLTFTLHVLKNNVDIISPTPIATAQYTSAVDIDRKQRLEIPGEVFADQEFSAGDIIILKIDREGTHGSDTYNNDWHILDAIVEFSRS